MSYAMYTNHHNHNYEKGGVRMSAEKTENQAYRSLKNTLGVLKHYLRCTERFIKDLSGIQQEKPPFGYVQLITIRNGKLNISQPLKPESFLNYSADVVQLIVWDNINGRAPDLDSDEFKNIAIRALLDGIKATKERIQNNV